MQDQLTISAGNLLEDNFPEGVDTFLFCHMFTIRSDERIEFILKKCFDSLPKGGKVIVFNMMSADNEYGPISCALGSPYFLTIATGEGKLHILSEYKEWFNTAGFKSIEYFTGLPVDHGFIVAIK